MRFAFTDDQLLFRDTVRDFLTKACPPERVREAWTNESGRLPEVWQGLADMGVAGLCLPEAHGGMGADELDLVLLLEETGRAALPEPVVETAAVGGPLLADLAASDDGAADASGAVADLAAEWLPRVASGESVLGVGMVGTPFVLAAERAGLLLVERDDQLLAVRREHVTLEPQPSVDGSRRLCAVDWSSADAVVLADGERGWHAVNRAFDRGALGTAAQLLGLADRMLTMTVDYATERRQFGVPIGSFQAIKHHLADALLALSFARPLVYNAAYSLAHELPSRSRHVSMAKAAASDAANEVGRQALQCHGAIGYTVEYDLHLYLKRSWALAASWGDATWHRNRVGVSLGI